MGQFQPNLEQSIIIPKFWKERHDASNVNAFLVIAIFFMHESACVISNVSHGLLLKIVR